MASLISNKPRFHRALALSVAKELCVALKPACSRLILAGSLRRGKHSVGDVEVIYIPHRGMHCPDGEIFPRMTNLADLAISGLLENGAICKRSSQKGTFAWGGKNKLAVHKATGIPVDLFTATEQNWWNYLVCRTGPADSNTRIAIAAQQRGWKWNPYGSGFSRGGPLAGDREEHVITSEEEVFSFVGLPFAQPWER